MRNDGYIRPKALAAVLCQASADVYGRVAFPASTAAPALATATALPLNSTTKGTRQCPPRPASVNLPIFLGSRSETATHVANILRGAETTHSGTRSKVQVVR